MLAAKNRGRLSKNLDRPAMRGKVARLGNSRSGADQAAESKPYLAEASDLQGRPPRKKLLSTPGVKPRRSCIRYTY